MKLRKSTCCLLSSLLLLFAAQASAKSEGFGSSRKMVNLNRINPPAVLITGTRLQVTGTGKDNAEQAAAGQIASQTGSEMVRHDPRLTLDDQRPQTVVEVEVLSNVYETSWETREETRREENGKDAKGKKQYRDVKVNVRYLTVNHRFSVAYKAQDLGSKRTIYADSMEISFKKEFQEGKSAPNKAERESAAVQEVVEAIVYKLVPTPETLQVLLPKGSLDGFSNLAEAGLWSRYSEAIESKSPFPSQADESYRQYALGLAYEAIAYQADDHATTLRYLDQAAQHYNSALSLNPKEDYFAKEYKASAVFNFFRKLGGREAKSSPPPVRRVQEAMTKYQTLLGHSETLNGQTSATGSKELDGGGATVAGMTNADVISMISGGVPEEIVLTAINDARECTFDTSPAGLIELTKAKVGKGIMKTIQSKQCD